MWSPGLRMQAAAGITRNTAGHSARQKLSYAMEQTIDCLKVVRENKRKR